MHKLSIFLLLALTASAQQLTVNFDPGQTQIKWTLAGNVHTVHGTFHLKQGHIEVNPATGIITGDLLADPATGESGNGARDKRMKKEILETDRFPEIRLSPRHLEGTVNPTGHSTFRLTGAFLIHGVTHNVTVPMDVSLSGSTVTGTGKFSIPYVEWGMKDPSNFLFKVDKSVEVEIVAVGTLAAQ